MAIDLEKSGDGENQNPNQPSNSGGNTSNSNTSNQSTHPPKDYSDPNSHPDVRATYVFTYECKRKGMPDYQIEQSLLNRGLTPSEVAEVIRRVNQVSAQSQAQAQSDNSGGGGGRIPGGLIVIAIIIIVDILSFAFDWGFILY